MLANVKPKPKPKIAYVHTRPPAPPLQLRRRLLWALAGGLGSVAAYTVLLFRIDSEMVTLFMSLGGALLFSLVPTAEQVQSFLAQRHWRMFDVLYGINAGVWFLAGAIPFGVLRSWKMALLAWGVIALGLFVTNSDLWLVWRFATLTPGA
jgi:hypothetical protein